MTQEHHRKKTIKHGTASGYKHYGCHCDLCRIALNEAERIYRDKRRSKFVFVGPKPIRHGTAVGYSYHRCRCELCVKYIKEYRKDLMARRMAEVGPKKPRVSSRKDAERSPEKQRQCGTAEAYSFGCVCDLCQTQGFQLWTKEIAV